MVNFDFKEGFLFLDSIPIIIFPIEFLIIFSNEKFKNNKELEFFLSKIIKEDVEKIFKINFQNKTNLKNKITLFLSYINSLGFGEIKLLYFFKYKFKFKIEKLFITNSYKNIFHNNLKKLNLELILYLYLKYFLEFLFNKEIESKYNIKNQNFNCFYNLSSNRLIEKNLEIDYLSKNEFTGKSSNFIKKFIIGNHLKSKNGQIKLWNANGILISQFFYLTLLKNLNKNSILVLNNLGYIQGKIAVDMKKFLFGISKKKLLKKVIENSQILGYGKIELKQIEDNYSLKLNSFINYYKNTISNENDLKILKNYYFNMVKGVFESIYKKEFLIKEINNFSILCIKTKKDLNLSKKIKEYSLIFSMKKRLN